MFRLARRASAGPVVVLGFATIALVIADPIARAQTQPPTPARVLKVDDLFALKSLSDPRISPDGSRVAFTVRAMDLKKDTSDSDIYVVGTAEGAGDPWRITTSAKGESSARFSPDGRRLSFLSSRDSEKTQVYAMDLRGGEAERLTDYKGGVVSYAWSPDGRKLAIVANDPDPEEAKPADGGASERKTAKVIVSRRLQFKRDGAGYLNDVKQHIHVFDVERKTSVQVTSGKTDEEQISWSPDGKWIAYVSNHTEDPDANRNSDVFVVTAVAGATPRKLTTNPSEDEQPAWSPDGKHIAYVQGGDVKDMWYATSHIALVDVASGAVRPLTKALDRNAYSPKFSPDGKSLYAALEDGGNQPLIRVDVASGRVDRIVATGERDVAGVDVGRDGSLVFVESSPHLPGEISMLAASSITPGATPRRLTKTNDALLSGIQLGKVERFKSKSKDGTMVDGFLVHPPNAKPGTKHPTILRIHGGPTSQYTASFSFEWQLLAAQGYLVIGTNPRGSQGYGRDFSHALFAKWGVPDVDDVLGAVDHVIGMGIADPDRLGVGGWSYGGILTNYVIVNTTRFKAATSGASISNILAGYGTDHYQYEYEAELGFPWANTKAWTDLSDPFLKADRIKTPTLFLCGQDDMNVPLLNSEQMYQSLRRLGVPTELVIYPGQNHGIRTPSYQKDRLERYVDWYDKYLRPDVFKANEEKKKAAAKTAEATSLLGKPLYAPDLTEAAKKPLQENLDKATSDFLKNPDSADNIIWLGRRLAYLSRYRETIDVFTRGIQKFPQDARMYRHRGHRYISTRQFDKAIADYDRAARLIAGKPDVGEPDGAPGRRPSPSATLNFNVYYHQGLAHYLKGDFERALAAYRECMKFSTANDDSLVATSDWLYMTLRRLGRKAEADKVLESIKEGMNVLDNQAYYQRLLMYKGLRKAEDVLGSDEQDPLQLATQGYGVGNFYLVNGDTARAKQIFERVVAGTSWAAFGFIASEAELARMK